jgi:hypothetical protein
VINLGDLTTIFMEGLPRSVESGIRNWVTPEMSFEKVVRLSHNLGTSFRQNSLEGATARPRPVTGVKPLPNRVPKTGTAGVLQAKVTSREGDR